MGCCPRGTGGPGYLAIGNAGELPVAAVAAISVDDEATTEIDDAFSVTPIEPGRVRVGIHIAAPALGFAPGSPLTITAAAPSAGGSRPAADGRGSCVVDGAGGDCGRVAVEVG